MDYTEECDGQLFRDVLWDYMLLNTTNTENTESSISDCGLAFILNVNSVKPSRTIIFLTFVCIMITQRRFSRPQ